MLILTGIGSRETPAAILEEMRLVGRWAREHRHLVRSGHAVGADWAFEEGAQEACEVYLPWRTFNADLVSAATRFVVSPNPRSMCYVQKFHPNPKALTPGGVALMSRNACQVLGRTLTRPSDAVICWTSDGLASGGTGQALRIAAWYQVPIFNMHAPEFAQAAAVISALETLVRRKENDRCL